MESGTAARKGKAKRGRPREKSTNAGGVNNPTGGVEAAGITGGPSQEISPSGTSLLQEGHKALDKGSCSFAPDGETDSVMLNVQSPVPDSSNITFTPGGNGTLHGGRNSFLPTVADTVYNEVGEGTPLHLLSFDKVTTRKRDRAEADCESGLFQNLNAAFSIESPRPFKRILRPSSKVGPAFSIESGEIPQATSLNGPVEISVLQYERIGLSPETSERSSTAGEPAGSA